MDESSSCLTAKSIKPINGETVHKICSGQVVLSLAVAVKELVENSLDAGATSVDVRLKNYGIDLIEVSDNGSGVTEDNFTALTLKYHTSKLSDYSDLLGVVSFGFRGEALSSLCALSKLTITTRHQSAECATKIEYDHKGNIVKTTPCARQVGTTVTMSNLFSTLPVRLKEFHKNAKREFNKMTQLLYAYCLISRGVKITCTNQTASNSKSTVVATQGSNSYKDNIACIFGTKQLQSILEIKPENVSNSIKDNILKGLSGEVVSAEDSPQIEDVEINLSEDSNDKDDDVLTPISQSQGHKNVTPLVEFDGFISSCAHGSGRSSSDRQFYYVNSRPCEPPKVMKVINEIYKQYNPNQYPFVFLNIHLDRTSVDVNVTPDKRKVFLTKEKIILDVLKNSLLKLFESIPRTLKVETHNNSNSSRDDNLKADVDQPRIFHSFLKRFSKQTNADDVDIKERNSKSAPDLKRKSTSMLDFVSSKTMKIANKCKEADDNNRCIVKVETGDCSTTDTDSPDIELELNIKLKDKKVEILDRNNFEENTETQECSNSESIISENGDDDKQSPPKDIMFLEYTDDLPNTQIRHLDDIVIEKSHTTICKNKALTNSPLKKESIGNKKVVTDKEDIGKKDRHTVSLKTCMQHVTLLNEMYVKQKKESAPERIKFRSKIDPVFNKKCEEELSREISKESFKDMSIIGQFNLGFIITKLGDDLFIIDQHATDEIYNFETLQKETELTSQKLVIPQQLELTGVNEQILMDNLEVFKKNGFTFEINEQALPTKRVKLLTIPMSKNWIFGKEDIEELLFMLRECPTEHCRPSRVRAMFASRACRKSVMIGSALAAADMRRLVDHMADIDKPWNCPHGRPTIRHLVNLAMVHTKDD